MRTAPEHDEEFEEQPRGLWSRFKDKIGIGELDEEEYETIDNTFDKRKSSIVRVHPQRMNHVSVWLSVTSFDNAKQAADGLKNGHQQIVNLERATPEVSTRIIDFLSGVIYSLEGYVEKVGDKVYLFTPDNFAIDVENGETARTVNSPFGDN